MRCICCDLPIESCGKAAENRQRAEEKAARTPHGASTTARFPGRCTYCGNPIIVGQLLSYDEEYGWVCMTCEMENLQ